MSDPTEPTDPTDWSALRAVLFGEQQESTADDGPDPSRGNHVPDEGTNPTSPTSPVADLLSELFHRN